MASLQPVTILYVEDNDDLRATIGELLQQPDRELALYARAEDALAADRERRFDIVVTDVSLPGMSGIDLARAVLRRSPEAWVVFSSGYPMGNRLADFGPHVRALLKPFDFADIRRLVDEIRADLQP